MFKKKILIIDDTEFMIKLTTDILREAGYEVIITASNGQQGLQKVGEEKPDLVILDSVMPGMDGFEVLKILRDDESNNHMAIIILSNQDDEDDKIACLEIGANDYIIKPFNGREFVCRVRNALKCASV